MSSAGAAYERNASQRRAGARFNNVAGRHEHGLFETGDDHFLGPVGGASFTCGCIGLWILAALGLAVGVVALVLVSVNLHRFAPLEDCCAATPSGIQSLDEGQHYAVCNSGSGVIGVTNTSNGFAVDDCNGVTVVMTRFLKPINLAHASTLLVCSKIGAIDDPAPDFSVALYADDGFGVPTVVLGNSSTAPMMANDFNCQNVTADLGDSLYLWAAFMSSGGTCDVTNNLYFQTHIALRSAVRSDFDFPVWTDVTPSSTINYLSYVYAMQVSYDSNCIGPV